MRFGFIGSVLIHAALIGAALTTWPMMTDRTVMETVVVPIDVVTEIAEKTNVTAAAPELLPDLPPQTLGSPQPIAPLNAPEAEPIPDPNPKKKKKEEKARPSLDLDRLQKMADRSKTVEGDAPVAGGGGEKAPRPRFGVGEQTGLTASEIDAIASKFESCWRSTEDMRDADRLIVRLRIVLGPDGRLTRNPELLAPARRTGNDAQMQVAVDRAFNAVEVCEPFPVAPGRSRGANFTFTFFARSTR
jgi:hypothetical protein